MTRPNTLHIDGRAAAAATGSCASLLARDADGEAAAAAARAPMLGAGQQAAAAAAVAPEAPGSEAAEVTAVTGEATVRACSADRLTATGGRTGATAPRVTATGATSAGDTATARLTAGGATTDTASGKASLSTVRRGLLPLPQAATGTANEAALHVEARPTAAWTADSVVQTSCQSTLPANDHAAVATAKSPPMGVAPGLGPSRPVPSSSSRVLQCNSRRSPAAACACAAAVTSYQAAASRESYRCQQQHFVFRGEEEVHAATGLQEEENASEEGDARPLQEHAAGAAQAVAAVADATDTDEESETQEKVKREERKREFPECAARGYRLLQSQQYQKTTKPLLSYVLSSSGATSSLSSSSDCTPSLRRSSFFSVSGAPGLLTRPSSSSFYIPLHRERKQTVRFLRETLCAAPVDTLFEQPREAAADATCGDGRLGVSAVDEDFFHVAASGVAPDHPTTPAVSSSSSSSPRASGSAAAVVLTVPLATGSGREGTAAASRGEGERVLQHEPVSSVYDGEGQVVACFRKEAVAAGSPAAASSSPAAESSASEAVAGIFTSAAASPRSVAAAALAVRESGGVSPGSPAEEGGDETGEEISWGDSPRWGDGEWGTAPEEQQQQGRSRVVRARRGRRQQRQEPQRDTHAAAEKKKKNVSRADDVVSSSLSQQTSEEEEEEDTKTQRRRPQGKETTVIHSFHELESLESAKLPLGSFRQTLAHMRYREFIRRHHGVFGTCTVTQCLWWILGCEFLVVTLGLMTCHVRADKTLSREFLNTADVSGKLCVYFFASFGLTLLLILKYSGPVMLHLSRKLSQFTCAFLLITLVALQIRQAALNSPTCSTAFYSDTLNTNGVIILNGFYSQLQLLFFLCSMINTLLWPRLHAAWVQHAFLDQWYLAKKQRVLLHVPQPPLERWLHKPQHGRYASRGGARVIKSEGLYLEAHGVPLSWSWYVYLLQLLHIPPARMPAATSLPIEVVFYVGQVDEQDRPHGFGRWKSESYHGESLVGYWDHGSPVGAFKSREFGTGSGFMSIRMCWCRVVKTALKTELSFGLGDAECCVSGAFFRTFPRVTVYPLTEKTWSSRDGKRHHTPTMVGQVGGLYCGAPVGELSCFFYTPQDLVPPAEGDRLQVPGERISNDVRTLSPVEAAALDGRERRGRTRLDASTAQALQEFMKAPAQRFFKRRIRRGSEDSAAFFKTCVSSILNRMNPHLPNFGIIYNTEVHITVDRERGLYIAGWVPDSGLAVLADRETQQQQQQRQQRQQQQRQKKEVRGEEERDSSAEKSSFQGRTAARLALPELSEREVAAAHEEEEEAAAELPQQQQQQSDKQQQQEEGRVERRPSDVKKRRPREFHQHLGNALKQPGKIIRRTRQWRGKAAAATARGRGGDETVLPLRFERPRIRRRTCEASKSVLVRVVEKKSWPHQFTHKRHGLPSPAAASTATAAPAAVAAAAPAAVAAAAPAAVAAAAPAAATAVSAVAVDVATVLGAAQGVSNEVSDASLSPRLSAAAALAAAAAASPAGSLSLPAPAAAAAHSSREEKKQAEELNVLSSIRFERQPTTQPEDPLAPDYDPIKGFEWISNMPELQVDGWCRAEAAGIPEVLLFVHGYNTNHVQSTQVMAQMLSFGNFPSYIKPLLFTWPAGLNFTEFFVAQENAKNPRIQGALKSVILALRDCGVRQIHIMAHSMGSRLLLGSLRMMIEDGLFSKTQDIEGADDPAPSDQMQLVTLIFLNPEYYVDDFVTKEYPFLRQYCSNLSIFCDAHDGALWWSERFSGRRALGRSVFGLHSRAGEREESLQSHASDIPLKLPLACAATNAYFEGYEPKVMQKDKREWLDVDVIDMTWLGHNVHAMRHSYWPLNREIIEDIRELVVTRKRASQRTSRLDRREGNVWVYRVAPSSLTSIFDSDI